MTEKYKRRHPRCIRDTSITYSFLNKNKRYNALTRNYARSGMYIESKKKLTPGMIIVIRPVDCKLENSNEEIKPYYCNQAGRGEIACQELKTMVTAQVKWCDKLPEHETYSFGVGVEYVSPAV